MVAWQTSGPGIHVDVTVDLTTNLKILLDQLHPPSEMLEEVLIWPPYSTDPYPTEHSRDSTDQRLHHLTRPQKPSINLPPVSQCQVPQDTLTGPLSMSWQVRAFCWWHEWALISIRQLFMYKWYPSAGFVFSFFSFAEYKEYNLVRNMMPHPFIKKKNKSYTFVLFSVL